MNTIIRTTLLVLAIFTSLVALYYLDRRTTDSKHCVLRKNISRSAEEIDTLVEELESPFDCIRSKAAFDLQNVGKVGARAVPLLIKLTNDRDDSVRWRSTAALGHIGIASQQAVAALFQGLDDRHYKVRINSVFSLGRMRIRQAYPEFIRLLSDSNRDVRFKTAVFFRAIALPEDKGQLIPEFKKLLKKEDSDLQRTLIDTINVLGWSELLDPISLKLNSRDQATAQAAARAINAFYSSGAFPSRETSHPLAADRQTVTAVEIEPLLQLLEVKDSFASQYYAICRIGEAGFSENDNFESEKLYKLLNVLHNNLDTVHQPIMQPACLINAISNTLDKLTAIEARFLDSYLKQKLLPVLSDLVLKRNNRPIKPRQTSKTFQLRVHAAYMLGLLHSRFPEETEQILTKALSDPHIATYGVIWGLEQIAGLSTQVKSALQKSVNRGGYKDSRIADGSKNLINR